MSAELSGKPPSLRSRRDELLQEATVRRQGPAQGGPREADAEGLTEARLVVGACEDDAPTVAPDLGYCAGQEGSRGRRRGQKSSADACIRCVVVDGSAASINRGSYVCMQFGKSSRSSRC